MPPLSVARVQGITRQKRLGGGTTFTVLPLAAPPVQSARCTALLAQWDGGGVPYRATGFKMSCMKDLAMVEPIVDVVDEKQVMCTAHPLLTIDLKTCTKADLNFR
jgi:hypothetical protein